MKYSNPTQKFVVYALSLLTVCLSIWDLSSRHSVAKKQRTPQSVYNSFSISDSNAYLETRSALSAYENLRQGKQATLALIEAGRITESSGVASDEFLQVAASTIAQRYLVCTDQPHALEAAPGFCSGVLIHPKYILTAGHCTQLEGSLGISPENFCQKVSFAFDFEQPIIYDGAQLRIKKSTIHRCRRIIRMNQVNLYSNNDVALIELSQPVQDRPPAIISAATPRLAVGTPLVMFSHPMGMPQKASSEGRVLRYNTFGTSFYTDLDAFRGSSGSPIFSEVTGELEGIVFESNLDFETAPSGECKNYTAYTTVQNVETHLHTDAVDMRTILTEIPASIRQTISRYQQRMHSERPL